MMTFEKLREDLPLTGNVAYFQVGSHGPTPGSVLNVVHDEMVLQSHYHSVPSVKSAQAKREETARNRLASFMCVDIDEVALTANTTQAMRQVARSISWEKGDEFVISSMEHVSTVSLGIGLSTQKGVKLEVVQADQGDAVFLENMKSTLTDRTKLVCVSQIASPDGRVLPINDVCVLAHELGIPVVVDAAQSLGQIPVNIGKLGCDFMVGSGHKWLLGPMGIGILWVSSDNLANFMPDPVSEKSPWTESNSPIPSPTAYDRAEGGTHNTALVIGLGRAIEIVQELGIDAIASRLSSLSSMFRAEVSNIGCIKVLTPTDYGHSAGITTLTFDGYTVEHLQALVSRIYEEYNIVVKFQWLTAPLDVNRIGMRVSIASFNTEKEVTDLVVALRQCVTSQ